MSLSLLVTGLGGLLGLLAFGGAIWRRRWTLWLLGYLLTVLAVAGAFLQGGS